MTMTTPPCVPQRLSSRQPSSTQVLSLLVIFLIAVQVTVVQLSFHGATISTTGTSLATGSISSSFSQQLSRMKDAFAAPELVQSETAAAAASIRVRKRRNQGVIPDGTFNGYPIFYRHPSSTTNSTHSSVQCVGQNFRNSSWMHRSCKFRRLCFETVEQTFVIYQSNEDAQLQHAMKNNPFAESSSDMDADVGVAIGGINTKWTWSKGVPRLRWFPKIVRGALEEDYYELDDDVVWVPFHSFFAQNPGTCDWCIAFTHLYTIR